jgi:hypothetical protein
MPDAKTQTHKLAGAAYTHYEWRSKCKPEAQQNPDKMTRITDVSGTSKGKKTQKTGLEAVLAKMEKAALVSVCMYVCACLYVCRLCL